ncbi:M20/M25/M40 family metallo-hydrolase [Solibacillus sp. FSL K6-1523]|uniref:M20/M25/M40 family metallo-hydrolase n=1 Tax=Solibacillus sp. FSL K6-1523 TaxID=2921471 RepID=UPI0030F7375B
MDIYSKLIETSGSSPIHYRIAQSIHQLAQIGLTDEGGSNRIAGSKSEVHSRQWLKSRMEEIGMEVSEYNQSIYGYYPGENDNLPAIMLGSHLDTVLNGGHFDGTIGVLLPLIFVEQLAIQNKKIKHPIIICAFYDEEGVVTGIGLEGSRDFKKDYSNKWKPFQKSIDAFIEIHIEQGPVLELAKKPFGLVSAIAGSIALEIIFEGISGHAGTVPMSVRQDPLICFCEWASKIQQLVLPFGKETKVTIGRIEMFPNVTNVIPKKLKAQLDIRHIKLNELTEVVSTLVTEARNIAAKQSIKIVVKDKLVQTPQYLDQGILRKVNPADTLPILVSGALHDSAVINEVVPTLMIFVRSRGGISHTPEEWTDLDDLVDSYEFMKKLLKDW